jgi:FtsP/CotA-like multicopper oxidase with cupredoxin domain
LRRQHFLTALASSASASVVPEAVLAAQQTGSADYSLRIARAPVEIAPGRIVHTTTYNGQFPGPLLRFQAGTPVTVDLINDTASPEQVHWHDPGRYDREVFLVIKEFEPSLSHGGDMAQDFLAPSTTDPALKQRGERAMEQSLASGMPKGYEVVYGSFTVNGRMLGHGEPIRVRPRERVLFHILNGSATEIRSLALPHHTFTVVALDGNPVPTPRTEPVLWIGTAERVDAIVEMNEPGVWVLGDTSDDDRQHGMGIVIEYAGSAGKPQWSTPPKSTWSYARFGLASTSTPHPDETIPMTFSKDNAAYRGCNAWSINGKPYAGGATIDSDAMNTLRPMFHLREGRRYRIAMRNASDDIHPIHLHRTPSR